MKTATLGLLAIAAVLTACGKSYPWEGFIYPKTGTMPDDLRIGRFATLEECRAASLAVLSKTTSEQGTTPDYECGLNCRIDDSFQAEPGQLPMRMCEETSK